MNKKGDIVTVRFATGNIMMELRQEPVKLAKSAFFYPHAEVELWTALAEEDANESGAISRIYQEQFLQIPSNLKGTFDSLDKLNESLAWFSHTNSYAWRWLDVLAERVRWFRENVWPETTV